MNTGSSSNAVILDYLSKVKMNAFTEFLRGALSNAERLGHFPPQSELTAYFSINKMNYKALIFLDERSIIAEQSHPQRAYTIFSVFFQWRDLQGVERSQNIMLTEGYSPLRGKPFFFFLCPYTAQRCKVLYVTNEGYMYSRHAFKNAHYRSEYEKYLPKQLPLRALKLFAYQDEGDPYRRRGKECYKGKLTPYGKKMLKYEKRCELFLRAINDVRNRH